jgi:hypothetical protein
MHSIDLYYNLLVIEPLGQIAHNDEYNCIKNYSFLLLFSSLLSFIASFQYIKSQKYTKLLWIMSHIHLYNNHFIIEPLWHE